MTKISKRLETITKFLNFNDGVVDVGCDHGLLSIYIYENKLVSKVIASDINKNALSSAINNINKRGLNIPTVLSDGIKNVNLDGINTLIISGMGSSTVLHILEDKDRLKNINKLVIQSNNDYPLLRKGLNDIGYYLENEIIIKDKGKWYNTCKFIKSNKKNTINEIKYGYLNNLEYIKELLNDKLSIYEKIPVSSIEARRELLDEINTYKKLLNK